MIDSLGDEFFSRIENCVNTAPMPHSYFIYSFLKPSLNGSAKELARFVALKERLEGYSLSEQKEGTTRLLNWVKNSIQDIQERMKAQETCKQWQREQEALEKTPKLFKTQAPIEV